jgi:hypothetical protein
MDKKHILDEIHRTARENGGKPLGQNRFQAETGIRTAEWSGKYWVRWSDALREAGYTPNTMNAAYEDGFVIAQLVKFIREIGRYPGDREFVMRRRQDCTFPSSKVFRRQGRRAELAQRVAEYCRERGGLDDVIAICEPIAANAKPTDEREPDEPKMGYVYMLKSGKHYKIGRTNALGRREYELSIQLPEKARTVHAIKTDDPAGIEAYWHLRFGDRRKNGEWFELTAADVKAFKRRKFM